MNPRVFGKYEVIRRLAVGGMGEIFLARQSGVAGFDRLVILKSLLPQLASEDDMLASFLDEARIVGSINHPNVVACFEVGEWEGVYFMAMEFINGVDVAALQKAAEDRGERFPIHVAMAITREAALGLDSAHHASDASGRTLHIVHRDISPHNVMVRHDGLTKVVDFGVALSANRERRTEVGMLKGKLGYMAPEQIKGQTAESFADQFSLGVMFWELLAGRRLFTAAEAHMIFMKIVKDPVPPPSSVMADIPPEVDAIVLRMTAPEPEMRYPRLADAAAAIRKVLDQRGALESEASDFVKRLVGAQLAERVADLTPGPVSILGVRPREPIAGGSSGGFCSACGARAVGGDRFCRSCGSPLGGGAPAPAPGGPAPAVSALPSAVRAPDGPTGATGAQAEPESSTSNEEAEDEGSDAPAERGVCVCTVAAVGEDDPEITSNLLRPLFKQLEELVRAARGTVTTNPNGLVAMFRGNGRGARSAIAFGRRAWLAAAQSSTPVTFRAAVSARPGVDSTDPAARTEAEQLVLDVAPGVVAVTDEARRLAQVGHAWVSTVARRDGKKAAVAARSVALPPVVIGRAAERSAIEQALTAARGGRAQQHLLVGDAGIGKSVLLRFAASEARDRGFIAGSARCGWHRVTPRYDAVRQAVRSACADLLRANGADGQWHAAFESLDLAPPERRRLLALVGDELDAGDADLPPAHRRLLLRAAVLAFFHRVAERRGLCLVIDDIHHADASSLEVFAEVCARLHTSRIAIVAAGRPENIERALPYARRVTLEALAPPELARVASLAIRAALPAPAAERLASRAGGNPLLVTLLARIAVANRLIVLAYRAGGAPTQVTVAPELARAPLPVHLSVATFALHALSSSDVRRTLEVASQLGQVINSEELNIAAGKDQSLVLDEAVSLRLLDVDEEGGFAFPTLTEQRAVADRVSSTTAAPWHLALANALEQRHKGVSDAETRTLRRSPHIEERLVLLALAGQDRARAALAAERAAFGWARLGAVDASLDHFRRALQARWRRLEASPSDEDIDAALRLAARATAALVDVDPQLAVDIAVPILKGTPGDAHIEVRSELMRARALALIKARRADDAVRLLAETLGALPSSAPPTLRGALLLDHALSLEGSGQHEAMRERLQEAGRVLGSGPRGVEALLALGRLQLRLKELAGARDTLTRAREEGRKHDAPSAQAEALIALAAVASAESKSDRGLSLLEEAVALASRAGDTVVEARIRQQMARARQQMGQQGEALAAARLAVTLAQRLAWDEGVSAASQIVSTLERRA